MAYKDVQAYQKNPVGYPSDDINPELKSSDEWYQNMSEALWSMCVSNQCAMPCPLDPQEGVRSIDELRAYATGRQNMNKIKGFLLKKEVPNDPNSRFVTKMNVSWAGEAFLAKMLDIMCSFNSKIDYDVNAVAIDDDSMEIKETDREYIKYFLNAEVQKTMSIVGFTPQMKINPQDIGATTEADIDLLIDSGGFNTQTEIEAQVVAHKTKKESRFAVIQDHVFRDFIVCGKGGIRGFYNKSLDMPLGDWVDAKYMVVPRSTYQDFRDTSHRGVLRFMSIAQLKDESDLTDAQLVMLAKDYAWMNPAYQMLMENSFGYLNPASRNNFYSQFGVDPINDVRVMVLDWQALSIDIETYLQGSRDTTGGAMFKPVKYGYTVDKNGKERGESTKTSQVIKKYEAKWIVGTKFFVKKGLSPMVKYKGEKGDRKPELDFHFAQTLNSSIIERCIAHEDDLNIALVKRRNAIATLPPAPRMIIEQGLLDNVELGSKLQEPEDLIKSFEERGILIVNRKDEFDRPVQVSGKTIEFVPSGIIEDITMFTNEIINAKESIKDVTGVNDITAAQTPQSRTGLGVSQLAQVASSNALFPTFNAFKYVFEPFMECTVDMWQMCCNKGDKKIAYSPAGSNATTIFNIGKEFAGSKFHLRMDMVIPDEEKQMILQEIGKLKDSRRQNGGSGGITGAQWLKLYDLVQSGNRKLAMFILAQIEELQKRRDLAITQANQSAILEGQQNTLALSEKAKQDTYRTEGIIKTYQALISACAQRKNILMEAKAKAIPGDTSPDIDVIDEEIAKTDQETAAYLHLMLQEGQPGGAGAPPQQGLGQQPPPQQQIQSAA